MDGGSIISPAPAGIFDMSNEAYHATHAISKSGLWTLHTKTPAHYKFGETKHSAAFDLGTASHTAILEPEKLGSSILRGPADRRGSKWSEAQAMAEMEGRLLLTSSDYDAVLHIRDAAHKNPLVRKLTASAQVERSAFWMDSETGQLCRVRPDCYSPSLRIMADVKTTADASPTKWRRSVADFGYHMQEAMYSEGWEAAGGGDVDGFVFIVIEKDAPHVVSIFELDRNAAVQGYELYRTALTRYAECVAADHWPGYSDKVMCLDLPAWAYRMPEGIPNV
jgi:hypothetical protein